MKVLILGGGASGLMAALSAAQDERNTVTVLERQSRVGRKLLATGNGRCNLTNLDLSPVHYHGQDAGFARAALAAFLVQLDPTVPQLADIKTAVSEAVTNCIVHAYPDHIGPVTVTAAIYEGGIVRITISDRGVGIPDVAKAMEPMFTTGDAEERAGLGFAVMQSFMDKVRVSSAPGRGTRVTLTKRLQART